MRSAEVRILAHDIGIPLPVAAGQPEVFLPIPTRPPCRWRISSRAISAPPERACWKGATTSISETPVPPGSSATDHARGTNFDRRKSTPRNQLEQSLRMYAQPFRSFFGPKCEPCPLGTDGRKEKGGPACFERLNCVRYRSLHRELTLGGMQHGIEYRQQGMKLREEAAEKCPDLSLSQESLGHRIVSRSKISFDLTSSRFEEALILAPESISRCVREQ